MLHLLKKNLFIVFLLGTPLAFSQGIGINTEQPDSSSLLDIYGENKGASFPHIYLNSINDNQTILNPAESLIIFNTNPSLFGRETLVFWTGDHWENLLRDIKTAIKSNQITSGAMISSRAYVQNGYKGKHAHQLGESINEEWMLIDDFSTNFSVKTKANILVHLTGMLQIENLSAQGMVETSFGLFVDDKLVDIKALQIKAETDIPYKNYEFNFIGDTIEQGNHTLKLAIRNRYAFDNGTNIIYGSVGAYSSSSLDAFSAQMTMDYTIQEK